MPERVLPDRATLQKWHQDEGLTYQQMADRWNPKLEAEGRSPVTHVAFYQACKRYGFPPRNYKHDELLPSNMRPDHSHLYDTEMIRQFSARKQGKRFGPVEDQRINSWLQGLADAKVVLVYRRNTISGWHPVKRVPTDDPNLPVRLPRKHAKKQVA